MPRNARYSAASLTVATCLTPASPVAACTVHCIISRVLMQSSLICCLCAFLLFMNMQYTLIQRMFTGENYTVRKKSHEKCRKFRVQFTDVSLPSKSSLLESWSRSFPTPTVTCSKLYYLRKCKAVVLATCMVSVISWTPCICRWTPTGSLLSTGPVITSRIARNKLLYSADSNIRLGLLENLRFLKIKLLFNPYPANVENMVSL